MYNPGRFLRPFLWRLRESPALPVTMLYVVVNRWPGRSHADHEDGGKAQVNQGVRSLMRMLRQYDLARRHPHGASIDMFWRN